MQIRNPVAAPGSIGPIQTNYPNKDFRQPSNVTLGQGTYTLLESVDLASPNNPYVGGGFGTFLYNLYFDCVGGLNAATVSWRIRFPGQGLNFIDVATGTFEVSAGDEVMVGVGGAFVDFGAASATFSLEATSTENDTEMKGNSLSNIETRIVIIQIGTTPD